MKLITWLENYEWFSPLAVAAQIDVEPSRCYSNAGQMKCVISYFISDDNKNSAHTFAWGLTRSQMRIPHQHCGLSVSDHWGFKCKTCHVHSNVHFRSGLVWEICMYDSAGFWAPSWTHSSVTSKASKVLSCRFDCGSGRATESFCTCRQYKNVDILILNRNFISSDNNGRAIEGYDNDRSLEPESMDGQNAWWKGIEVDLYTK